MLSVVATRYGTVRGSARDGVTRFLGIPYAAPPFGANRFREPRPVTPWDGVRDALAYGPTAPKPGYEPPYDDLLADPVIPGGDCLNLNVWTPGGSGRPVMVWVHGGAFRNGTGAIAAYDGAAFARDGVVCVTINYRLGAEGFARIPGAPGNRGLLDQIAALEWVRDNIEAFGGDPGNVTVFGESAGGMSVTTLLSLDTGLFRRAIAQSGAGHVVQAAEDADLVTADLAARLGVPPSGLVAVPPEKIIVAQAALSGDYTADPDPGRWGATTVTAGLPFLPVIDGELLARRPVDAIADGAGHAVPLITGTTTEEFRLFLVPSGIAGALDDAQAGGVLSHRGIDPGVLAAYRANRPDASPGDLLAAVITDLFFRVPAYRVAEARAAAPAPTYVYEFAWRTAVRDLGASHALEIPFVFDTLGSGTMEGPNPPRELATAMHGAWVAFAAGGDPGWPAYDASRPVMRFDAGEPEVVHDPRADERLLWDTVV